MAMAHREIAEYAENRFKVHLFGHRSLQNKVNISYLILLCALRDLPVNLPHAGL